MDEFKIKPSVRVFLSTDAGQTGLNLQNASVCINLDLPWNPARLEQRIGRVHRIGQKRSVRVINFVAQGTIEQGMINVLKFKKSVFGGVLDGGENTVMMGETRLNRFMKEVAEITEAAEKEKMVSSETGKEPADTTLESVQGEQVDISKESPSGNEAMTVLLQTGMQFLSSLISAASQSREITGENSRMQVDSLVETNPETGKRNLKIPLPGEETMKKIAEVAVPFLSQFLDTRH